MTALKKLDYLFIGFGIFFTIIGIGIAIGWSVIFNYVLETNLILKQDSKSYSMWVETPLPMYLDIHLFHWENSAEFTKNSSVKPKLKEIGPFVFREVHDRVNVTWNPDGSVSYNQTRNWTFVPEMSLPLNISVTNLNVIALGAAHSTRYSGSILQMLLNEALKLESHLFVTKPASQWLFEGMDLPLLKILNSKVIKKLLPFPIPYDKFGFFYGRNMSAKYDGRFDVLTGSDKLTDLGNIYSWNKKNKTDFFNSYCGMVNGSSGEIFPPTGDNQDNFTLFISDVCSSLTLKFSKLNEVNGVTGRQFVGDETMLDNGQLLAERSCFCEGECQPSGVRNLTKCRQGAPVFVSFPHFYLADPSYTAKIDGLKPNKSLHEFEITLNPLTGIPLDVRAQLQVNILLQPYSMYKMYKNMPKVYIPMLWFRQRAHITDALSSQASLLGSLNGIGYSLSVLILILGVGFIVGRMWIIMRRRNYDDQDDEPIIEDQDS